MLCGQRIKWVNKGQEDAHITVDQELKVEEFTEVELPADYKHLKNPELVFVAGTDLHATYRSLLGKINWLQNRTRYDAAYDFSRCASAAVASPSVADINALNALCWRIRNEDVRSLKVQALDQKQQ